MSMLGGMAGVSAVLQQSSRVNPYERLTDLGYGNEKKWTVLLLFIHLKDDADMPCR